MLQYPELCCTACILGNVDVVIVMLRCRKWADHTLGPALTHDVIIVI